MSLKYSPGLQPRQNPWICPKCETENETQICKVCGTRYMQPEPKPDKRKNACPSCGRSLPIGATSCPSCHWGERERWICRYCNTANDISRSTCLNCKKPRYDDGGGISVSPPAHNNGLMMAWSIVTIFLCTILGIISTVKVFKANNAASDSEREKNLKTAKILNIIGCVIGIFAIIGMISNGSLLGSSQAVATPKSTFTTEAATPSPQTTPTAKATPSPESSQEVLTVESYYGAVLANTYVNDLLKIGCQLDSSWTFSSQDELMEIDGLSISSTDINTLSKWLADGNELTCLGAYRNGGIQMVALTYAQQATTTSDLENAIDSMLPQLRSEEEANGVALTVCERQTRNWLGQACTVFHVEGTLSGYPYYEEQIFLVRDEYVVSLCIYSAFEDVIDGVADSFFTIA